MKRTALLVAIAIAIALYWLRSYSFYSPDLDLVVCNDEPTCLHENAHRLDYSLGNISRSEKFEITVRAYLVILWNHPELRDSYSQNFIDYAGISSPLRTETRLLFLGNEYWGGYSELYADIYKWAEGDIQKIPPHFRDFYRKE